MPPQGPAGRGLVRRLIAAFATALLLGAAAMSASAEQSQKGNLRLALDGALSPTALPRHGAAPVAVSFDARIDTTDGATPPQLQRIALELNRAGRLHAGGLPRCNYHQIQPASTEEARASCERSLIGTGFFRAHVALPEQSPFPSRGRILAFNGNLHGRPVIYAHVYGNEPLPQSSVLAFEIRRGKGEFGTRLVAELPRVAADWGYVSGVSLKLRRTFVEDGRRRSYISASCPAPKGFPGATFTFARAAFDFADGRTLRSKLTRSCRALG